MRKKTSKTKNYGWEESDSINPMDGVSNLADVMLCLAVGIMLALITHWNVDIGLPGAAGGSAGKNPNAQEIEESMLNKVDSNKVEVDESGEGYEKLGQVYKDPQTGKIYIITEGE